MKTVAIEIKRLPHMDGIDLPHFETEQAAGADLRAAITDNIILAPGERKLIPTGFCMALPAGYEAQVRPRSGLALKHGITVLNSPGTIDADYRGEVGVLLINHGDRDFTVSRGDRFAQMVIAPVTQGKFQSVEILDDTVRGSGGYGSTGTG
ncbi:dUTP diphosphatase [Algimonas porphyrae]|uniref:Deoxyuridine 5'-triphosphate nucleotidohydrolase n=1 Tax=Algimonas porphyrae TaxID=1128113 RepID=A0ABQ5UXB6_9PROT|nr:dUTP diphosphatase [Algimonas porphyrae]GLQ19939.1 deoxyuridine 5'-triphosphate nucleotidohydrolase [Algimonas porphyrae]